MRAYNKALQRLTTYGRYGIRVEWDEVDVHHLDYDYYDKSNRGAKILENLCYFQGSLPLNINVFSIFGSISKRLLLSRDGRSNINFEKTGGELWQSVYFEHWERERGRGAKIG